MMVLEWKNLIPLLLCLLCQLSARPVAAALTDWFWKSDNDLVRNGNPAVNAQMLTIPYESKTEDEKFLEEALKFTDVMKSSDLDICQHNVVLKIKTSCSSMTEEELAKMSVNLLNCQSAVDGRERFPCTEQMSLKECTVAMDANMWNAYHMMNNRARAVCLSARRVQFQILSEMTVNKLLTTAQDQITRMASLQQGQEKLETLTAETMGNVQEGNLKVLVQQQRIQETQKSIQNFVAFNLQELTREKALIAAGHKELADMTGKIKEKLDEANKELLLQSLERTGNHQQIMDDIDSIRRQADSIFQRIDESTEKLLSHHAIASKQYEETLQNLWKINATVGYLTRLFATTHSELDKRIDWIKSFLGSSGEELARISHVVLHIAYLMMGMLLASFMHIPLISRAALIFLVPLNLLLVCDRRTNLALDFPQMTVLLVFTVAVNFFISAILRYVAPAKTPYYLTQQPNSSGRSNNGVASQPAKEPFLKRSAAYLNSSYSALQRILASWLSNDGQRNTALNDTHVSSSGREENDTVTPRTVRTNDAPAENSRNDHTHNLVSSWLDSSQFPRRAGTPATSSIRSGSGRNSCSATCLNGRRCKNPQSPGLDVCRRHEAGSSAAY